jgi:gluconolactonase
VSAGDGHVDHAVLATAVGVVEGPVWHDDHLWFTRLDGGGSIQRLERDDVGPPIVTGGGANGLAVDRNGDFYVANDGGRDHDMPSAIQRIRDGAVELVLDRVDDARFRHCNDLCFGPDGWLWFTDSGEPFRDSAALVAAGEPPVRPGLVCRVDPCSGTCEVADASLYMPNGLAFSPGDDLLYVADTVAHRIVVFPYAAGALGAPVGAITIDGNPDGMCLDVDGRLYVATAIGGEVHVHAPDGRLEHRLRWADGAIPLNCCFGGPAGRTLFVTDAGSMASVMRAPDADHECERIVAFPLDVEGLALHG